MGPDPPSPTFLHRLVDPATAGAAEAISICHIYEDGHLEVEGGSISPSLLGAAA
jgi:hypothetical protein